VNLISIQKQVSNLLVEFIELVWEVIDDDENNIPNANAIKWWNFKNKVKDFGKSV